MPLILAQDLSLNKKHNPDIAKEPTTNSVLITWNVEEEIIGRPPLIPLSIHGHTIAIAP